MRKGRLVAMNYQKIYYDLIETRQKLNRMKRDGLYENHHIIPRSLGGDNSKENLVLLTPKEHYIAHLLLVQIHEGKNKAKMVYALMLMNKCNHQQTRITSASRYQYAKDMIRKHCSGENASFYGRKLSAENILKCAKIEERMKGKDPWNKGKKTGPQSKETIEKKAKALLGRKRSKTDKEKISIGLKGKAKSSEHKAKLSIANQGKKLSDETKIKMSKARKNKKQGVVTCPHCRKASGTTMFRWHFDNCKSLAKAA